MLLTDKLIFSLVLIVATQTTRLLPLLLESKVENLIKSNSTKNGINDVLFFLLILYCFRDLTFTNEYFLRLAVSLYVFLIQFKYERTLFSIFSGTLIYMFGRYIL